MKFKKIFNKGNHRKPRANAFVLESLEPRLLLSATPLTAAVVTTDHLDYAPGETAVITTSNQTGDGLQFGASELVRFQVSRTDGMADHVGSTADVGPMGNEAWYVTDGVGGFTAHLGSDVSGDGVADWIAPDNDLTVNSSISTTWYVEEQYRNSSLVVTAAGQESGAVAGQMFTDAIINTTTPVMNSAPSGADTTITLNENTPYTFSVADFGFTDPNDSPANVFQSVMITALPIDGTLTLNGTSVQAGDSITLPQTGGMWTAHENNRTWSNVASSADGMKLVAGVYGGQLYTSTDAGVTWTAHVSIQLWYAVASSADGMKLVAGVTGGHLYTSIDAGVTWTARESNRQWTSIASSADGMNLVAGALNRQGSEHLYTSTDAGVTWTARASGQDWTSVASSADGMKLVAGALNSQLYTSIDAGVTWTARESNRQWTSIASSADGMKLVAGTESGQTYTSTDAGVTWTVRKDILGWVSVASSADGTKLVATADGGQLYTSTDAGVTWTAYENTQPWRTVASSADGSKLVAATDGGQLYTSVPQPLGLVYTPAAGAHGTSLASVSFQVQDSGGTANGGVNRDQTANTITLNVTPVHQPVTATVTSSASTSTYGDAVTLTATLTPAAGTARPAGLVQFFDGATSLGSTDISNNGTGLDSIFTLSISTLTAGTHMIHAVYTATDALVHSTSGNITQMVSKANATVTGYSGVYDAAAHGPTAVDVFGESLSGLVLSVPAHTDAGIYLDTFTFTDMTGNYNNVANGSVISSIAKAEATITVEGYTGVYDAAAHGSTGMVVGVLGDLSAAGASLDLGSSFTNAPGGTAGWTFIGGTNYNDKSGSVAITINAKAISYTIGNASHIFGSTIGMATVLGTTFLTGVNGENLGIVYSSTGNRVASLVGNYAIHGSLSDGTGMLSNYYVTINSGTLTVTTPRVITIVQDGVNLIIVGTDSCDTITVNATKPNSITVNREAHGGDDDDTITGGAGHDVIFCDMEKDTLSYSVGAGGHVIVYGMAGRDNIRLTGTVNLEAHGGDGNDTITGGAGHDVIWGDQGNDTLTGSAGNDVLIGGSGSDQLVGSAGHDLLISGELMGDHNGGAYDYAALRAIDDSWAANWSVDSDLESTSGDVLDESGSADKLTGSSGHDWFILGSTDKITDIKSTTKDGDKITY
jgi:Ca2+-binding RTX toxin-like protein